MQNLSFLFYHKEIYDLLNVSNSCVSGTAEGEVSGYWLLHTLDQDVMRCDLCSVSLK